MSYSEVACQRNPNINIFFIPSEDIEKKSDEMTEHWHPILPMPNTVKLHCIKTQGPDKLHVSNVSNGEAFSIIRILPATIETLVGDTIFDQNLDRKNFSIGDWVLVKHDSINYPGKILQIVNNEFLVNVTNKSGKFWRWPQKEDKIFPLVTILSNILNPHKLLDHVVSLSSIRFDLMITYYYINCCYFLFLL